jgi:Protein of unknown function (DUF1304)
MNLFGALYVISPVKYGSARVLFTGRVLASTRNLAAGSGDRNMIWIANLLVALVAALHVHFLVLEMFLWTKPLGLKTFRNSIEKATDSAVLAANQGLYNGFLAAGLIWGWFTAFRRLHSRSRRSSCSA